MAMINLSKQDPPGRLLMSEAELDVFATAFTARRLYRTDQLVRNTFAQLETLGRTAEGDIRS
jgi:hypothetical protein